MVTLVDCGCQARVHGDGSGIELDYCVLHGAAAALQQALCEVLGDHILLEEPSAIPICCFCSADEGALHEPECTMNVVLAALDRAGGREPRTDYVVGDREAVQS